MTIEDIIKSCEQHGFGARYDETYWEDKAGMEISQYTPAGEDWYESFDASSPEAFIENLKSRVDGWDSDEEAEPYIEMRGQSGVPDSIRDLLDDADWKESQLKDLLDDIEKDMKNDSTVDNSTKQEENKSLMREDMKLLSVAELPDMCYGVLPSDCSIIIIKKGENCYYTTNKNYESEYANIEDYEEKCKKADEICNKLNAEIDVTPEQRQSMEIRSMFGNWEDKKEENNTFGKTTTNDAEYYNYVKGLLDSGAIDDPEYYNKLSDAEKDDLIRNTWMKDDEIKKGFTGLKEEAVTPDKEYMGVKYFDNKDGRCPICNSELTYDAVEHVDSDMEYYPWTCDKCGQRGEAWFKEVFQGHTVITPDTDDNIDLPFDESDLSENKKIKVEDKSNVKRFFIDNHYKTYSEQCPSCDKPIKYGPGEYRKDSDFRNGEEGYVACPFHCDNCGLDGEAVFTFMGHFRFEKI